MSTESGIWGNFNFIKFPNNVSYYEGEIRYFSLSKNQGLCMQQSVDFPDANLSQWRESLSFTGCLTSLRVTWEFLGSWAGSDLGSSYFGISIQPADLSLHFHYIVFGKCPMQQSSLCPMPHGSCFPCRKVPLYESGNPSRENCSSVLIKDWGKCCMCTNSINEILKTLTHHASPYAVVKLR